MFPLLVLACIEPVDTALVVGDPDGDGDGWPDAEDCGDDDPLMHPDQIDACDGVDNDCDGSIDEDAATATWYRDQDADGYGDPAQPEEDCRQPAGYVADSSDCGPARSDAYPGADEHCDGVDHDCDGETMDQDSVDAYFFFEDADEDGFGNPFVFTLACYDPGGFVGNGEDCDDTRADVNPAAPEVCDDDDVDEDCDLWADSWDDWAAGGSAWWPDADGDGFGDLEAEPSWLCGPAEGFVEDYTDCDDGDASVAPGMPERCNEGDDDCDGEVDEDPSDALTWYEDRDLDGHGDPVSAQASCEPAEDWSDVGDDCDDHNDTIYPGAPEDCFDAEDHNCDGYFGTDDADGDGYAACEECDDGDPGAFPGGVESCDGTDDDCDGEVDEADAVDPDTWYADADGDGYGDATVTTSACEAPEGFVADDQDCDDADASVHPDAVESCELPVDADCDGLLSWADTDGDASADCVDCAPEDPSIHPGATETPDDGIDQDCDGVDSGAEVLSGTGWWGPADGAAIGAASMVVGELGGDASVDVLILGPDVNSGTWANGTHYLVAPLTSGSLAVDDAPLATIVGNGATGLTGEAAAVGDDDGDGGADLFLGAALAGFGGTEAGEARLLHGPFSGALDVEADAAFRVLCGGAGAHCGDGLGLSDQDADGVPERIVAAPGLDFGGVLVYAGALTGDYTEADAAALLVGVDSASFGDEMRLLDVDGDGVDDLVATDAAARLWLFDGPLADATTADATGRLLSSNHVLADEADLDGDGLPELLVASAPERAVVAWSGLRLDDEHLRIDDAGTTVTAADLDGSGGVDLVVGDPDSSAGSIRFFPDLAEGSWDAGAATLTRVAGAAGHQLGASLAPLDDVDGDGRMELLIGAPGADSAGTDDGFVHLLPGAELP